MLDLGAHANLVGRIRIDHRAQDRDWSVVVSGLYGCLQVVAIALAIHVEVHASAVLLVVSRRKRRETVACVRSTWHASERRQLAFLRRRSRLARRHVVRVHRDVLIVGHAASIRIIVVVLVSALDEASSLLLASSSYRSRHREIVRHVDEGAVLLRT